MNWIVDFVTTARDEVRFRLDDRETRRTEKASAARAFPIEDFERRLEDAGRRLTEELERLFDAPMRANRVRLAAIRSVDAHLAAEFACIDRNHSDELTTAHSKLADLRSDLEAAKRSVGKASDDLKTAKARISSWHHRSKSRIPIYGKRGKHVPQHSFFSFSVSDLDSAKSDADDAASEIGDAIRRRKMVIANMDRCRARIAEIKASRERRKALLDAGRTRSVILAETAALQFEIARLSGAEERMGSARRRYADTGPEATEAKEARDRIRAAIIMRAEHMKAFDAPEARAKRRTDSGAPAKAGRTRRL